nr:MAG TPA: hypothetical protein [Caudoviricetes sp.]
MSTVLFVLPDKKGGTNFLSQFKSSRQSRKTNEKGA